ncbi:hypothetical protein ArV1_046 [Arthrobacter phage vB_ArtM-ArV1]|uniref:Uncharacterized protein n=1 Tax=Arthrobacter phage vB_ArtM-ArV1 TaxID=1566993 RepID=A0A0A7HES6_9CAUD|nr:hypothetical protein ArV1_046 [Arthrobacter phage vB_ArtM-ArV1]AIZ01734.1 hypothetical protein ArV1_046 [Arthrobacter phage vB_ArtM-ArV1]
MKQRDAHDAAGRIYDAMDDGKLKTITQISAGNNGHVEAWVGNPALGYSLDKSGADLLAFMDLFPGGSINRMGLQSASRKGRPAIDRARYMTSTDSARGNVLVILHYYVAHQCEAFSGRAETGGKPKWWCVSCKKPVTTTKAREIGLLPKLNRKRK